LGVGEKMDNSLVILREKFNLPVAKKRKVQFTPTNYNKTPFFNLQLQNRITEILRLLKPDKFNPLSGFEGGFFLLYKK